MRRLSARKLRIGILCKAFLGKGKYKQASFQKKSAFRLWIASFPWQKAYIKVTYNKGHYNDGEYTTHKDLTFAINAFTEKDLLDYFE